MINHRRALLACTALFLAPLAACSVKGGSSDSATTTKPGATQQGATTTEATDAPSDIDYSSLLLTEHDLGRDWTQVPNDDDDDDIEDESDKALDKAYAEQCPEAVALDEVLPDTTSDDEAEASFEDDRGRTLVVTAGPAQPGVSETDVDTLVETMNACSIDADVDGERFTMAFDAEKLSDFDLGLSVRIAIGVEVPEYGTVDLTMHAYLVRVGDIDLTLVATDGSPLNANDATFDDDELQGWLDELIEQAEAAG